MAALYIPFSTSSGPYGMRAVFTLWGEEVGEEVGVDVGEGADGINGGGDLHKTMAGREGARNRVPWEGMWGEGVDDFLARWDFFGGKDV